MSRYNSLLYRVLRNDTAKDRLVTIEKQIYKMIVSSKKVIKVINGS